MRNDKYKLSKVANRYSDRSQFNYHINTIYRLSGFLIAKSLRDGFRNNIPYNYFLYWKVFHYASKNACGLHTILDLARYYKTHGTRKEASKISEYIK